jgi:hypothetical protein
MTETIELRVARVTDREALLELLTANGVETEPLDEDAGLGFRIPCKDADGERTSDEVIARVELLVADAGLPLVPERGEGFVVLRPPSD